MRKNHVYSAELFWIRKINYPTGLNSTFGQSETIGLYIAVYIHETMGECID